MKSLTDAPAHIRLKLSTLWTATMFCYVYGDYFGLYADNKLASMAQGSLGPIGPATPGALVAVSLMMAIPALLIAATLYLPAAICRWSNIAFGLLYTAIMAMTLPGAAPFYITLAVIEMTLTAAIVIAAWTWAATEGGSE